MSEPESKSARSAATPIAELEQQRGWFGRNRYQLTETHIFVDEIRPLTRKSFSERYSNLSPDFSFVRQISSRSFVVAVVSLILFVAFSAISFQSLLARTSVWKSGVALCCLCVLTLLISLRELRDGSLNDMVFRDRYARRSAFSIRRNSPSAREVESFVAKLLSLIRQAEENEEPAFLYGVADELRNVAALREDGVITDEEYRELKKRLIGGTNSSEDSAEFNLDSHEVN